MRNLQGNSNKVFNEYEQLEARIRNSTGVECSVFVKPNCVSIRAASYADYVLARGAIKGMVMKEIVRDQ